MGETETHITSYQQVGAMSVGLFVLVPSASLARYVRPPFPISRSRLECERCSLLELIWRVRVFCLRWRCMLRNSFGCFRLRRGLTEAYVNFQAYSPRRATQFWEYKLRLKLTRKNKKNCS